LNDIFGFDGWCLEVKETRRECCEKDSKDRYCVSYTSLVRVTHRQSGAFKEDCGAGDCVDRSLGTAISHALKASVTDAMKRAVRHFGDKLGNSLYESSFNMNNAPKSLKDALIMYEIERAKCKFGFEKDRVKVEPNVERLQEEEYSVSTKEYVHNTASVPQDANRSSAMDNGSSLKTETGATRPVPSIAGASGNLNPNHLARNNTNSTGALNPVAGGGYNYHVNHGNVRHQVSNTYKTNEIPNTTSSTSTVTNTAATITSSISSSGPSIKNETIHQMHTLVNSSVTSNISPNGIKRFQNTNATTQKMPGANNNNFGDSLQPLPTVQIPSLPISNIYSRSHEPLTSSYAARNVLSDVTNASNSVVPLPHGPINNSYCVNNAKRPVQDDQENSVLPGSKKAITTYSMSNPYMTTKK
jgi:DNA recombination protein Rad52